MLPRSAEHWKFANMFLNENARGLPHGINMPEFDAPHMLVGTAALSLMICVCTVS